MSEEKWILRKVMTICIHIDIAHTNDLHCTNRRTKIFIHIQLNLYIFISNDAKRKLIINPINNHEEPLTSNQRLSVTTQQSMAMQLCATVVPSTWLTNGFIFTQTSEKTEANSTDHRTTMVGVRFWRPMRPLRNG